MILDNRECKYSKTQRLIILEPASSPRTMLMQKTVIWLISVIMESAQITTAHDGTYTQMCIST